MKLYSKSGFVVLELRFRRKRLSGEPNFKPDPYVQAAVGTVKDAKTAKSATKEDCQ